jgi:hypothetical protein
MSVEVTAKTPFVHGKLTMEKGETTTIPEQMAKDLRAAGLVSDGAIDDDAKAAPTPENKMVKAVKAKAK